MANRYIPAISFLLIACLGLAGCTTSSETKKDAIAKDSDYEWVTPLGSNVPVKVRKGSKAASASPTSSMTADQASQMIHSAGSAKPAGGN